MGIDPGAYSRKEIGRRLEALREGMGLSQVEMVELCRSDSLEFTPQEWNNWESGRQRPSAKKAILIADATGAGLDYIFRAIESDLPARDGLATRVKAYLAGKLEKLPRKRRKPENRRRA